MILLMKTATELVCQMSVIRVKKNGKRSERLTSCVLSKIAVEAESLA